MVNIWMIAGGMLAAAAAAMAAYRYRRHGAADAGSVNPVSDEWLSHARASKEQEW